MTTNRAEGLLPQGGDDFEIAQHLVRRIADALRPDLPDVAPGEHGHHECQATGMSGPRKLDVSFSTRRHGLELGISILSIRDTSAERVDEVLRRDAEDLHGRQPHAVLAAYVIAFEGEARDARKRGLSLDRIAAVLGRRCGRSRVHHDHALFEHVFLCMHPDVSRFLWLASEGRGRHTKTLSLMDTLRLVRATHRARNEP